MTRKIITRVFLAVAIVNFAAMFWFAQYVVSGWLIYLYVVGSFTLWCLGMVMFE